MKAKTITPERIGRLKVLESVDGNCRCLCDCGNEKVIPVKSFRTMRTQSCGCLRRETTAKLHLKPVLPGTPFGRLKVLEWNPSTPWRALCVCACGNRVVVDPKKLRSGHTQSCGCLQRERAGKSQIVVLKEGQTFGKLTVLEQFRGSGDTGTMVKCQCSCPAKTIITVSLKKLTSGHTKSCGCLRKDVWKTGEENTVYTERYDFKRVYGNYRSRATARGLEFSLSREEVRKMLNGSCAYCGERASGIDRVNNDFGYITTNVVGACIACNRAKYKHSREEFLQRVSQILAYQANPSTTVTTESAQDAITAQGCWLNYRYSARKDKRVFELSLEEFFTLTKRPCYYCGEPPSSTFANGYVYNGLDRVTNSDGYTLTNSVPCCPFCNRAKGQFSPSLFLDWAKRVAQTTNPVA